MASGLWRTESARGKESSAPIAVLEVIEDAHGALGDERDQLHAAAAASAAQRVGPVDAGEQRCPGANAGWRGEDRFWNGPDCGRQP